MPSLIEIGLLVLEKIFFFSINICKYRFSYLETMMLKILNLHYIRQLSCKYDLFWLSGSGKEDFSMTHPIFAIISPLKRAWPFI